MAQLDKWRHRIKVTSLGIRQRIVNGRRPEVRHKDMFGKTLQALVSQFRPKKILEIGSWDGSGSTFCLLRKMYYTPDFLHCVEVNPDKAKLIRKLIVPRFPFVEVHCCSSISYEQWCFKDFDTDFWDRLTPYEQRVASRVRYLPFWERERKTLLNTKVPAYFEQHPDQFYDLVVIDGAEFTAVDEYRLLNKRFNLIALDDVFHSFKCSRLYEDLIKDDNFELIGASQLVRKGFAAFARKGFNRCAF